MVIVGNDIVASGGIDKFPVTVTNPGTDVSAYFSCPIWITRDPETGVYNVGTYRVMVKAPDRAGVMMLTGQDSRVHWDKARCPGPATRGGPLPLARAGAVAVQREQALPARVRRRRCSQRCPLEVVQAETVDVLIPATAEIAIEGRFFTDVLGDGRTLR